MGKTEPVDQAILPNLRQMKLVFDKLFEDKKILSIVALVKPYKFPIGCAALSVEIPTTVFILCSIETLAIFDDPTIFVSIHSNGNFSDKSTNFVAAACIIISGLI